MRDLLELKKKYPCTAEDIERVAEIGYNGKRLRHSENIYRKRLWYFINYWSDMMLESGQTKVKLGGQGFCDHTEGVNSSWFDKFNIKTPPKEGKIKAIHDAHPEFNIDWWLTGEGYFLDTDEVLGKKVDEGAIYIREIEQKAEGLEKEVNRLLRLNSMLTERLLKYGEDFTGLDK